MVNFVARKERMLFLQGYMDLAIITAGAKANTRAPCTWQLIAKDGIYLMQIPRQVDNLVLAAGNRCSALHTRGVVRQPMVPSTPGSFGAQTLQPIPWQAISPPFCCRAEVLVECDGNVGDTYYLASGYLRTFGAGYGQFLALTPFTLSSSL